MTKSRIPKSQSAVGRLKQVHAHSKQIPNASVQE